MLYPVQYMRAYAAAPPRSLQPTAASAFSRALDALEFGGVLAEDVLAIVSDLARSEAPELYEISTSLLGELSVKYQHANDRILQMIRSPIPHIRHNAILSVDGRQPATHEVLRLGLLDKSARVREKAADWIGRLVWTQLLDDLEKAESMEKGLRAKRVMHHEIQMLRNGYAVNDAGAELIEITVSARGERKTRLVQRQAIESLGLPQILVAIRDGKEP